MKKLIILTIMILFFFSLSVQAIGSDTIKDSNENKQVQSLINYMNNIKSKNELIGSVDAKTYIKDFMLTGDGKFSNKKLVQAITNYALREVISSLKLMATLLVICIVCALLSNL